MSSDNNPSISDIEFLFRIDGPNTGTITDNCQNLIQQAYERMISRPPGQWYFLPQVVTCWRDKMIDYFSENNLLSSLVGCADHGSWLKIFSRLGKTSHHLPGSFWKLSVSSERHLGIIHTEHRGVQVMRIFTHDHSYDQVFNCPDIAELTAKIREIPCLQEYCRGE